MNSNSLFYVFFSFAVCMVSLSVASASNGRGYFKLSNTTEGFKEKRFHHYERSNHDVVPIPEEEYRKPWHGQYGLDKWVCSVFDCETKRLGFYVDLAANHYMKLSTTFSLDRTYGWKGICIEPNAMYRGGLLVNRTCDVYINPVSERIGDEITFENKHVFGSISKKGVKANESHLVSFVTVTLTDILQHRNAPPVIEFLSLDVETHEEQVLRGFDFKRYTFLTVIVEGPSPAVHHILASNGYFFVNSVFGDCMYVHKTLPNIAEVVGREKKRNTYFRRKNNDFLLTPKWSPQADVKKNSLKLNLQLRAGS